MNEYKRELMNTTKCLQGFSGLVFWKIDGKAGNGALESNYRDIVVKYESSMDKIRRRKKQSSDET